MDKEVERLRIELLQERAWREELQALTIELTMENERLKKVRHGDCVKVIEITEGIRHWHWEHSEACLAEA